MKFIWQNYLLLFLFDTCDSFILSSCVRKNNIHLFEQVNIDESILRQIDQWACIKNCGACCKLGPLESRPDLNTYLSSSDFELYKTMIGRDNWCIHFDKEERKCNQYESRPLFCKVDKKSYKKMFGIDEEDFNDFCNFCCREQIQDVYGEDSDEMNRFNNVALALELELDADMDEDEKN